MTKINNFIEKNCYNILLIFLFLQPFLDIVTAISIKYFAIELTIGSITRLLFFLFCLYYLFFLSNKNKKNRIIIAIFLNYIIIFSLLILKFKDSSILFYELKNLLNTFYLPFILLAFIQMFKQYNISFPVKIISYLYFIYIFFIIVPTLTNTSFLSYSHSKVGTVGWFLSANAVGNILSILYPIVFIYFFKYTKNNILKCLFIILTLYIFTSIGTKAPILSLGIGIMIYFLYFICFTIKKRKYKHLIASIFLVVILTISSCFILPKTSFYKNLEIHKNYLGLEHYTDVFTNYDAINQFIFSERLTFLKNTHQSYVHSNLLEKFFGIGYIENYHKYNESIKTVEIDYADIFYRHGIIGFILYFSIFLIPLCSCIKKAFKKLTIENISFLISILLTLLLSLFSGHALITPAVSIYICLLLAMYLTTNEYLKID